MDLLELDPSPSILVLITLHSKIYNTINSTESRHLVISSFSSHHMKLPSIKTFTFAHALKTTTPSIAHFLRSLDAICLNHIFFSNPDIFQSPDIAIRSYQATSSIVWNTASPSSCQGCEDATRRLPIHTIPSSLYLSDQLEMMKLRGHVDTILVEMAVEVGQLDHPPPRLDAMNTNEEHKEESVSDPKEDKHSSSGRTDMDFRGLAKECLCVLQRMEEQSQREQDEFVET